MKKLLVLMITSAGSMFLSAASDTPCTDAWAACSEVNGYGDEGCDAGWDTCIEALYG